MDHTEQQITGYYPQYQSLKGRESSVEQLLEQASLDPKLIVFLLHNKKLTANELSMLLNFPHMDSLFCLIGAYTQSLNSPFPGFRNIDGLMRAADEFSNNVSEYKKNALDEITKKYASEESGQSQAERKEAILQSFAQYTAASCEASECSPNTRDRSSLKI